MIRFEEKKLVIEIDTAFPVDTWLDLHRGICDIVRNVKQDNIIDSSFYNVVDLLEELTPNEVEAKKMVESNKVVNK